MTDTSQEKDQGAEEAQSDVEAAAEDPAVADAEAADATAEAEAPEEGPSELGRVRQELDDLEERHLRLAAEFDNYRKRNERERLEHRVRSQAQLVAELLDALDDLERVAHVEKDSATIESVLEGVRLVERKLRQALESAGLEPLDAEGEPFDPGTMDALMTVPTPVEHEEDTVADVFQKGYRFKDLLVRPAKVRVKKYDPDADAEDA